MVGDQCGILQLNAAADRLHGAHLRQSDEPRLDGLLAQERQRYHGVECGVLQTHVIPMNEDRTVRNTATQRFLHRGSIRLVHHHLVLEGQRQRARCRLRTPSAEHRCPDHLVDSLEASVALETGGVALTSCGLVALPNVHTLGRGNSGQRDRDLLTIDEIRRLADVDDYCGRRSRCRKQWHDTNECADHESGDELLGHCGPFRQAMMLQLRASIEADRHEHVL